MVCLTDTGAGRWKSIQMVSVAESVVVGVDPSNRDQALRDRYGGVFGDVCRSESRRRSSHKEDRLRPILNTASFIVMKCSCGTFDSRLQECICGRPMTNVSRGLMSYCTEHH